MLTSLVHYPSSRLGEFVEYLYLNQGENFHYQGLQMPLLHQELFYNLGEVFRVDDGAAPAAGWLTGLHTRPLSVHTDGRHFTIGVLFKPWGLYQGFGIPARDIVNRFIHPGQLVDKSLEGWLRENAGRLSGRELLGLLEVYLTRCCRQRYVHAGIIELASQVPIQLHKGTMAECASRLHLSSKTLIEAFHTTIGMRPLQYFHLKRVNQAIQEMRSNPGKSLTELAFELDFYDQPHFIRIFKSFCRMTPGQFQQQAARG